MDSTSQTFHFTIDGENALRSIVEAIAFVKGRDPLDLEPLGRTVDPDALDEFVTGPESVSVSFELEDLEVTVTSSGDIHVTDPTPDSVVREPVGDASNVLLKTGRYEDRCCVDLLSLEPDDEACLLGVGYAGSVDARVSAWDRYMDEPPADTALVHVGDFPRSATADGGSVESPSRDPVTYVPDASDVSELDATIAAELSAFEDSGKQLVVCFDSITRLLRNGDRERSIRFLEKLTARVETTDGVAHYHFDPEPFEAETVERISSLFDVRVEVAADGSWTVESD